MPESIGEGKTVEAATEAALMDLGCKKEEAEIEVLQEAVKGIFGRTKAARVKVIYNRTNENAEGLKKEDKTEISERISRENMHEASIQGQNIVTKILTLMGIENVKIKAKEEESTITLDIQCEPEGLLIGRQGQTLSSLQYLVNRVIHNTVNKQIRYIVDVGGYKIRHKTILEKMANRIAQKVSDSKEEEQLKAMSAYDRRIIHVCVKDNPEVTTYSLGEGNFRRVVIAPKDKAVPSEQ
ncbi:protein jag [bacterium]|nr:protein jag [bacterium]